MVNKQGDTPIQRKSVIQSLFLLKIKNSATIPIATPGTMKKLVWDSSQFSVPLLFGASLVSPKPFSSLIDIASDRDKPSVFSSPSAVAKENGLYREKSWA